jgi:hypothetical protein
VGQAQKNHQRAINAQLIGVLKLTKPFPHTGFWDCGYFVDHQSTLCPKTEEFRAAREHAPQWGRNQLKWGESLLRAGHEHQARTHLALARDLYLSASERAELGGSLK